MYQRLCTLFWADLIAVRNNEEQSKKFHSTCNLSLFLQKEMVKIKQKFDHISKKILIKFIEVNRFLLLFLFIDAGDKLNIHFSPVYMSNFVKIRECWQLYISIHFQSIFPAISRAKKNLYSKNESSIIYTLLFHLK